jgi:hypothetical protein
MAWNIDYYLDAVPEGAGNGVRAGVFLPLASFRMQMRLMI